MQLGSSVRGVDGGRRGRAPRRVASFAVAILTLSGTVVATGGPAGSADRKRDQERASGKRHSEAAGNMPARFVAEADGRVVVVRVGNGRLERHLTDHRPGGGAADPAVSPDGRTVWFSRGDGTCAAHLASVPLAGGEEQAVPGSGEAGPENQPLPRPGRAQLAFARTDCDEPGESLVVGDLRGLEGYGQTGFFPLAWSRDGNHLLAVTSDTGEVHLLGVNKAGAIVTDTELAPPDRSPDCRLEVVGFSPDDNDGYVAIRRCGRPGEEARRSLVLLDRNGGHRKVVLRLNRGLDFVDRVAFDPTGRSVLYSTAPAEIGSADPEITLWLRRDGQSRRVARQSPYRSPSWLP